MHLSGLTAVITGGCSGLGFATAKSLAAAGTNVVLLDINQSLGARRVKEIGSTKSLFVMTDVTSAQSVEQALQAAKAQFGEIAICVNCAGIAPAARTLDKQGNAASLELFSNTIQINLIGTYNVCRLVAASMASNEAVGEARGVIINTASIAGYEGQIGQTAYAASKAGIIGLTLPLARDLAPMGIRVNSIAPGVMGTPMVTAMPESVQTGLAAGVPWPKRLGLPEEFASLVLHIIQNDYINGETIRLDGALRMPPK